MTAAAVAPPPALESLVRAQAYGLGFDLVGIATLGPMETAAHFERWLDAGRAGEMHYLPKWRDKRADSRLPFPGVSSAIVVGMDYGGREPSGPVARYARGDDYHDVMVDKLRALHAWLNGQVGREIHGKAYVDTGPILERDLARRAGLGWFGKNTMLIHPRRGSFFFLGALVLDLHLAPDAPFEADRCGSCTRCLDACPTDAFPAPYQLDATRCISYLTIEKRGAIPEELRSGIGRQVFGCDICQDVCPWNREAPVTKMADLQPRAPMVNPDLEWLAGLDEEKFREVFRGSPVKRARFNGLRRNVAIALGNSDDERFLPILEELSRDEDMVVAEHARWALRRLRSELGGPAAK